MVFAESKHAFVVFLTVAHSLWPLFWESVVLGFFLKFNVASSVYLLFFKIQFLECSGWYVSFLESRMMNFFAAVSLWRSGLSLKSNLPVFQEGSQKHTLFPRHFWNIEFWFLVPLTQDCYSQTYKAWKLLKKDTQSQNLLEAKFSCLIISLRSVKYYLWAVVNWHVYVFKISYL